MVEYLNIFINKVYNVCFAYGVPLAALTLPVILLLITSYYNMEQNGHKLAATRLFTIICSMFV